MNRVNREAVIRFTIRDTGIGMPLDKQQYIFESFSKLSRSQAGVYKGLGIGLPIVKKFVADLEGEIDLKSVEGEGTMIAFSLPFRIPLTQDYATSMHFHQLDMA